MDRPSPRLVFFARRPAGLIVAVLVLLIGGCAAAGAPSAALPATSPAVSSVGEGALGAPAASQIGPALPPVSVGTAAGSGTTGSGSSSASGASNAAVAYPYPVFGGSAGLAPDHELVVSGTGWATVRADLSDRAAAQRTALTAALADAKAQALAAANDAGVTLGGVVSLSVSVGGNYIGIMPMGAGGAPQTVPSAGGATPLPPGGVGSAPSAPTSEQLTVTVTVAYSIR